jgi:hypothetical protein
MHLVAAAEDNIIMLHLLREEQMAAEVVDIMDLIMDIHLELV